MQSQRLAFPVRPTSAPPRALFYLNRGVLVSAIPIAPQSQPELCPVGVPAHPVGCIVFRLRAELRALWLGGFYRPALATAYPPQVGRYELPSMSVQRLPAEIADQSGPVLPSISRLSGESRRIALPLAAAVVRLAAQNPLGSLFSYAAVIV